VLVHSAPSAINAHARPRYSAHSVVGDGFIATDTNTVLVFLYTFQGLFNLGNIPDFAL
jgi:hypothetical protein